jgi:hypothetical protein
MPDLTTLANLKAWLNLGQVTESAAIPGAPGPYTVTVAKAAAWNGDAGVILEVSGQLLTPAAAPPGAGHYSVAAGVYTFNAAQAGLAVNITYTAANPQDPLLARLLSAVSAFIQEVIGYQVASQAYDLVVDGHGGDRLAFGKPPLTAVAHLTINGLEIPLAPDTQAAGYRFTASAIILQGYQFVRGAGNVEISCTRGWAATPPELEQACLELAALRYKERDHIGQEIATMQGQNVTFSTRDMPNSVKTVLNGWKKVAPL